MADCGSALRGSLAWPWRRSVLIEIHFDLLYASPVPIELNSDGQLFEFAFQ